MFTILLQTVKDMLFPVFCLGCKREGIWLCKKCIATIDTRGELLCPVCHEEQPYGMCCADCRGESALDSHLAATVFRASSLVGHIVHALKYEYAIGVVPHILEILDPLLRKHQSFLSEADIVVPIPLHPRRFAERGFNQSDYIAEGVSLCVDVPVQHALIRSRYTRQQATLEREERADNMEGVFALAEGVDVRGKDILLVDDVYTTGSTMQAAAKTLRKGGASSVVGLSVARG